MASRRQSEEYMDLSPLWITCKVAFTATVIATILAVPLAALVGSMKRGKRIIDTLLSLPLVLPPTVVGFFLLILFGFNSAVGRFFDRIGIDIIFTVKGAVIASVVVALPIIYRPARAAFEQIDQDLIDAARLMGYVRFRLFIKVYVPLCFSEIVTGVILAFARSIGEFGATIMVAGNIPGRTRTMSVAVYTAMQSGNRTLAYQWTAIILCMSFVVLLILDLLAGKQFKKQ